MKHSKNKRQRGGLPSMYFNPLVKEPSVPVGNTFYSGIRAGIPVTNYRGGSRRKSFRRRHKRGGFVPSVMGGFVTAVSKYITPIALFSGYKLMTRKKSKK